MAAEAMRRCQPRRPPTERVVGGECRGVQDDVAALAELRVILM